jgi:hypothetical protein
MGDERFYLLREMEQPHLAGRKDLRVGLGFEEAHRRLIDELDAAHILDVHVALVAGQKQAHRVAVAGLDALAVLIERDHRVIQRLLDRHAAMQGGRIGAFGQKPRRLRIDASLLQQGGEQHPGPFRVGNKTVQRLRGHLHRLIGEHRRRIAAAFEEMRARDHRVTRQRLQGVDQRLLHQPVDEELVLRRIDIGNAGMADREEQAVGRYRTVQHLVRGARVGSPELVVRIAERADHVLLEPRRHLVRRHHQALFQAPRIVLERLGGRAGQRGAARHGAGNHGTAAQQRAAIEQAVASNLLDLRR